MLIRLVLKQPNKSIVTKTNQLPSTEKALFYLCLDGAAGWSLPCVQNVLDQQATVSLQPLGERMGVGEVRGAARASNCDES